MALPAIEHAAPWDRPTMHYLCMFLIGIVLALHRDALVGACRRCGRRRRWGLSWLSMLTYTWLYWLSPRVPWLHTRRLNEMMVVLGSAVIIVLAQSSDRLAAALRREP